MAKNITLMGANYPGVPAVQLPQTGGGAATFVDADEVENVENAMAIVIDGDTAPQAITPNQYLFIKNHSTLPTGGYHAIDTIQSGATISTNNVAADPDGIANGLQSSKASKWDLCFPKTNFTTYFRIYKGTNRWQIVPFLGASRKSLSVVSCTVGGVSIPCSITEVKDGCIIVTTTYTAADVEIAYLTLNVQEIT